LKPSEPAVIVICCASIAFTDMPRRRKGP
jgi:hypothetical protein